MTGRQWEWNPRMAVVVAAWVVAGYIASRVLPDWLWSLVGFARCRRVGRPRSRRTRTEGVSEAERGRKSAGIGLLADSGQQERPSEKGLPPAVSL
jgi:hypothetical protein